MPVGRRAAHRRGGRPTRAACSRSTGCASAVAAPVVPPLRGPHRHRLRRRDRSAAPTRAATARLDHARHHPTPTPTPARPGLGPQRRDVVERRRAGRRPLRRRASAASSPASRCSTTPRDASKVALVGLVDRLRRRRRRAARRAVDDPAPRRRSARSTCPGRSTSTCWPQPSPCPSTPSRRSTPTRPTAPPAAPDRWPGPDPPPFLSDLGTAAARMSDGGPLRPASIGR